VGYSFCGEELLMGVGKKVNDYVIKPLADLSGASLSRAKIEGAKFADTTFPDESIKNPAT
jgi:uncharacterized protein YjbI with pentapeptide repeats